MEFQYNAIMTVFVSLFGGTSLSNVRIKAACVWVKTEKGGPIISRGPLLLYCNAMQFIELLNQDHRSGLQHPKIKTERKL